MRHDRDDSGIEWIGGAEPDPGPVWAAVSGFVAGAIFMILVITLSGAFA